MLFLTTCIISHGQTVRTNFYLEKNNKLNIVLNGRVKTLKIKNEDLKQSNDKDSVVYFFDKGGNADKIIYYTLGLDVLNKRMRIEEVHYTFKKNKLLSKLNKMDFGIDGDVYEYDERWNLISLKNYFSNILVKESLFKYDSNNRKIESISYLYGGFSNYNEKTEENKINFLYEIEKYEFDAAGRLALKMVSNFKPNKQSKITTYKYDERGNLIEEGNCIFYGNERCNSTPLFGYEYNSKNQLTMKYQFGKFSPHNIDEYFVYDDKGNEIESKGMEIYTNKLPFWGYHFVYEYDEFGNKTKEEELIGRYRTIGHEQYKVKKSQYDKFQNLIFEEYLTAEGTSVAVIIQKYIYDKKGNWIKREKAQGKNKDNLSIVEICTREINYYN